MDSILTVPFKKQDLKFFNCYYTHIYSYLSSKSFPIELLLYKCLQEPHKLFQHFIGKGQSRWNYFFTTNIDGKTNSIFDKEDLECIGLVENIKKNSFSGCIELIQTTIKNNRILFLMVDPFYLPHSDHYQKVHGGHWIMITGYDELSQKINILDEKFTFYEFYEYGINIIKDGYENGAQETLFFTDINVNYDRLKERYVRFFENYQPTMECFFNESLELLHQQKTAIEKSGKLFEQLYHMLNFLSGSIQSCRIFLEYIRIPKPHINQMVKISFDLENMASVIKKFEVTNQINFTYIEGKITEIKDVLDSVIGYLKSHDFSRHIHKLNLGQVIEENQKQWSFGGGEADEYEEPQKGKENFVDLQAFFNNQGFGVEGSTADFTGSGEFFLVDNLKEIDKVVTCDPIHFRLSSLFGLGKDNISCTEQVINLNGIYKKMWLLGCGEWGDATGQIVVKYEDNYIETFNIQLTDWAWEPKYGEKLALSSPIFRKEKIDFAPDKGSLFAKSISLDETRRILNVQLPFCPNLHVFSITLTS
ncbi:hypothetical protein ACQKFM_13705 [Paenibacillus xylanexedens]|uniref:hypothetical protein n=1 Tax=Paenibacillus xylanexedens TaxID=528191 RepID=UPI003CFDDA98